MSDVENLISVNINDIALDIENPRMENSRSQQEAIHALLLEQKDKMVKIAEDIIQYGLNPSEFPIVINCEDESGYKYIVLEGNRRICALKILMTPNIIGDDEELRSLKKKFQNLSKTVGEPQKEINCYVVASREAASHWLALKHTGENDGAGTVRWSFQQQQKFEGKLEGQDTPTVQLIEYLKHSKHFPNNLKMLLDKTPTSNIKRLIDDPAIREFLGLKLENGLLSFMIEEKESMKGIIRIFEDYLCNSKTVDDIYHKQDREKYIESFGIQEIPDLQKRISPLPLVDFSETGKFAGKANRTGIIEPYQRNRLIPRNFKLIISNTKIQKIFYELQHIDLDTFPLLVSISLRVFLELSLDCYMDSKQLHDSTSSTKSNKKLHEKVNAVTEHMRTNKIADETHFMGVKKKLNGTRNNPESLDTLSAYIHNTDYYPTKQDLLIYWDTIQKFIEILWGNIQ